MGSFLDHLPQVLLVIGFFRTGKFTLYLWIIRLHRITLAIAMKWLAVCSPIGRQGHFYVRYRVYNGKYPGVRDAQSLVLWASNCHAFHKRMTDL